MTNTTPSSTGELAVVHKHYPERGGAERVADELARTFQAPVLTGIARPSAVSDDVDVHELFADSRLAPILRRPSMPWQAIRDAYYYFAWDHEPRLAQYDVLVQSGNAPWWYVPEPTQTVVRYVHSPPRLPYDRYQEAGSSRLVRAYSRIARQLFESNISYCDQYVANSEAVARRLEQAFNIPRDEIAVVYPPVDTAGLDPVPGVGDYYLGLSRLHPAKRFGEVIRAFGEHHPEKTLLIAGDGSDRQRLEDVAQPYENVTLLGYVSEPQKRSLLQNARALVYNAHQEDFGLVVVEAYAAGTPVIGVQEGFTRYQIEDGYSGITYERGVDRLADAISRYSQGGVVASPDALGELAEQCQPSRFRSRMRDIVDAARAESAVQADSWRHSERVLEEAPVERSSARSDGGDPGV